MVEPCRRPPRLWQELAILTMLSMLVVFGLAANGRSLLQTLVALGFGVGVLLLAWLWQRTLRRAKTAPPVTRRERTWNAVVFVAWLAVVAALICSYFADCALRDSPTANTDHHHGRTSP